MARELGREDGNLLRATAKSRSFLGSCRYHAVCNKIHPRCMKTVEATRAIGGCDGLVVMNDHGRFGFGDDPCPCGKREEGIAWSAEHPAVDEAQEAFVDLQPANPRDRCA